MKNIVNRALVAKKKQFLSKSVPRGTRTIWRYLSALFILFTFAVGNVWGAEIFSTDVLASVSSATVSQDKGAYTAGTATSWSGSYENYFATSGSAGYYQLAFSTAISLSGYTDVKIKVYWGSTSNRPLNLTVNGGSATKIDEITSSSDRSKVRGAEGNISETSISSLKLASSGGGGVYLFRIEITGTPSGGDPVDPVFTYTPATYTIGDPALDLSTKLTSTNTTGAITFAISTSDAGTTGASIASSKNFTATTAGTAKVTVSQAASTGYNAKSQDIEVTVVEPDPCTTYFHFVATADATANGKTNWDGFTNAPTGSNGQSNSVTIDGSNYTLTKRTGSTGGGGTILGFTIPANKAGTLYGYMKSSGTAARTLSLKKGDDVVKTNTEITDGNWTLITISAIAPGTYTLSPDQNVQIQMFALKVCDATFHTITLDLDGGTGATSIQALDGVPATKPADPTKAHATFAGWVVKSTSAAYDWSANVTGDFTLKATWTQLYTVTYEAGDGTATGDAPTQADLANGEKFTVAANTFAVAGKDFVKWNDGTNDYAPGAEYTIASANVVLTAQWKAASAKYTVHYMDEDGTTPLAADELVEVTQKPAGLAEDPTKPLYTFASWQLSGVDIALDAASWTSVAANTEVTLTARWAKAYATSYDMEAYAASVGASKAGIEAALTAANYAYTNINDIDNGHTHNYTYDGLKYKTNDGDLSFNVVAGKVVEVKTGHLPSNDAITMYINGVANATIFEGADEEHETHKTNYFYSAAEALYRLDVKASKGTCAVKKVTIRDPYTVSYNPHGADEIAAQLATPSVTLPTPVNGTGNFKGWYDAETEGNKIGNAGAEYMPTANITLHAQWETVSSDNTLSDLQVDGATIAGFDPAVQIYNLVYEYGQQPVITSATATAGALATVTINNTPVEEATFKYVQVKVEAESGAERFYQVRYTNNPKQGATIFKAELTSNTAADYSGMYADGDNSEIKLADDGANGYKFSGTSNYVKMAIADATFAEGDMLKMTYTTNPQQGELAIYDGTTKLQGTAYSNHILTFSDAADGKSTLYIRRTSDNNFNGWVAEVEVQRYMAPIIKSYKIGAVSGTIDQDLKTIAIELPYGTSLYGVAATIEAYANGGATVIAPTPLAYDTPLGYKVSSAYAEDGDVDYTVTITEADHYEAMIVGGANYTTLAAAVADADADDVVKLLDNVDLMATGLTIAENITLDLNGFNIKAGEQIDNDILVPAGKKLTLVDNSANAEGKIYTEQAYTGAVTGYGLIRVDGELLMQSGNIYAVIESDPANLGQFAVVLGAGGKATIEGGQIKAGWYAISNNGNNTGSTIIVSGGELISTADFAIYNPAKESTVTVSGGVVYGAAGGIAMNRGELTVTGGTITSKDQGTTGTWGDGTGGMSNAAIAASGKYESVEVEISGGTIIAEGTAVMITNGTTNPVEVAISGGQFSHVVPAEYCADGFAPVTEPNAQGKYEVEDKRIYIFDGSTMSDMATGPTTGAIQWAKVGSTMGAGDKDKTYEGVHYTRALSCGSSSTTKHFRIDVALNNAAKIEVIGMSNSSSETRHAWLTNSTEKGEYASAIAGLATTGYNPEMFTTDWLEEGSYYLHSDNTVAIFLIRVTSKEVDPKCEQPTITTQPATDLTFGAGNMTATVEAEVSDEGTLTYQWYNAANDEAVVGQTTATLTTADEGTYYVIVTNTKASHRDNSIKSDEAQLAHRVMNDATLSALGYGDPATAIALEADKYDYRVDLAMGTIDVPELTATATMAPYSVVSITNATEFVNYEATSTVLVTAEDGVTQKTYTVKFVVDHVYTALVDVTESTTWNWTGSTEAVINDVANKGLILANYIDGANFEMIEGKENERARRNQNGGVYQGTHLHFNTTVAGKVKFYFRAPSSGENCTITVKNNGKEMVAGTRGNSLGWSKEIVVKGDVVIEMVNDKEGGGDTRVQQIVFTELAPDYTRNVSSNYGTLCVEHNVLVGGAMGATFYQIASRNEDYDYKIDFEEVLPNEELKAGEPYLFKSNTGKIELFYGEETAATPKPVRGMIGNYEATTLAITAENMNTIYYFAQNKLWLCDNLVGSNLILNEHRAYIDLTQVPTYADYEATKQQQQNSAPRRRVSLEMNGEKIATGCENLKVSDKPVKMIIDGQLFILRGEKMYDAKGQLVK